MVERPNPNDANDDGLKLVGAYNLVWALVSISGYPHQRTEGLVSCVDHLHREVLGFRPDISPLRD